MSLAFAPLKRYAQGIMKKLVFATLGLIVLLIFSVWAKNANFNLKNLSTTSILPTGIPTTTNDKKIVATPTIPIEILITVTPNGFVPDVIMITPGTKITWVNKSGTTANIKSDSYTQLNLGNFSQNNSVSFTFSTGGRFSYYNGTNPTQHGTIVVGH